MDGWNPLHHSGSQSEKGPPTIQIFHKRRQNIDYIQGSKYIGKMSVLTYLAHTVNNKDLRCSTRQFYW